MFVNVVYSAKISDFILKHNNGSNKSLFILLGPQLLYNGRSRSPTTLSPFSNFPNITSFASKRFSLTLKNKVIRSRLSETLSCIFRSCIFIFSVTANIFCQIILYFTNRFLHLFDTEFLQ